MAFPTGPLSEPARQGRGLQLDTAFLADIPNRTSPSEFLIGTKIVAPFSFPVDPAEAGGRFVTDSVGPTKFSGYSWELWDKFLFPLAQDYGCNYTTYRVVQFANNDQMLRAVTLGLVDAGHAALTKNIQRAEIVDFTTGWFDTGLAIMTRTMSGVSVSQAMSTFESIGGVAASLLALIAAGIVAMALAIFILERALPGPRPVMRKGCFAGIRDSGLLATQLLVGASARVPSGSLSRPVATCCSLASSLLTIVVTAIVTVSLQSASSATVVENFADLSGKTMLMPEATSAESFVNRNGVGIKLIPTASIGSALERFQAGEADSMLYDQPILSAFIGNDASEFGSKRFALVGELMERQQYGIALNPHLPDLVRESLDKAILAVYGTTEVADLRARWLYTNEVNAAIPALSSASGTTSMMEFLGDNVQPAGIIVGTVVGVALVFGVGAFCCRSSLALHRRGELSIGELRRWLIASCVGNSTSDATIKRRRKSIRDAGDVGDAEPPSTPGCLPQWLARCSSTSAAGAESLATVSHTRTPPAANYVQDSASAPLQRPASKRVLVLQVHGALSPPPTSSLLPGGPSLDTRALAQEDASTTSNTFGGMAFGPDGGSKGAGTPLSAGRGGPLFDVVAKAVTETPTARSTRNSKTSEGMPGLAAIGTADDAADCGGGGCHTGALETHPAFGVTARERLFFKREQWAMRAEGKLAPVLSPNDLLWEVWQRVDMLAQQALLQRAMGRLDVPADLEDVPPELVEEESRLLAGELVTQGMDPQLAKRAAMVAAMAGVHEDEECEDFGNPSPLGLTDGRAASAKVHPALPPGSGVP
ncbi:hypothetical protein FNF28_03762 [Cafeteria roenbergensis]|nr:hypothetical protein FNF28_03762 [Cafeteria roenbergensis]